MSCYYMLAALKVTKTEDVLNERKRAWACRPLLLFLQMAGSWSDTSPGVRSGIEALVRQQGVSKLVAAHIL